MSDQTNIGTWEAFTRQGDFIRHIYVHGSFPTDGSKPLFTLKEAEPQGIVPGQLILELSPDVIDPDGSTTGSTEPFSYMDAGNKINSVLIRTQSRSFIAGVPVESRPRK